MLLNSSRLFIPSTATRFAIFVFIWFIGISLVVVLCLAGFLASSAMRDTFKDSEIIKNL